MPAKTFDETVSGALAAHSIYHSVIVPMAAEPGDPVLLRENVHYIEKRTNWVREGEINVLCEVRAILAMRTYTPGDDGICQSPEPLVRFWCRTDGSNLMFECRDDANPGFWREVFPGGEEATETMVRFMHKLLGICKFLGKRETPPV